MLASLQWLARHQNPDGSWSVVGYTKQCKDACSPNPGREGYDTGVTALSLLAFAGAGYSHLSKDVHEGTCFGDVVKKGLGWMMRAQDKDGCIGSRSVEKYMYNHAIATLALTELYGLTGSGLFKAHAQKAVDFLVNAQNPGKAWRYSLRSGDNDTSVTGWAVMALKSAELANLSFPRRAYDGARTWLDETFNEKTNQNGYIHKRTGKVYVPGLNEQFHHHEALTAIGVMSRIFIDRERNNPRNRGGCELLVQDLPVWKENHIDFYYWYYGTLALMQHDGPEGKLWKQWNESVKDALLLGQNCQNYQKKKCVYGSWEPVSRWSLEGGRVYATAINCLTLEIYYRYANTFGTR